MKKIMSIILALTLAIGLLPTAFASDEAAASDGYSFVFSNAAHTGTADATSTVSFSTTAHSIDTTVASVSDSWGYVAEIFPNGESTCSDKSYMRVSYYRPDKNVTKTLTFSPDMEETASAICFEFEIDEGGLFVPTLNYSKHNLGPIVELYLVPKSDVNEAITSENLSDIVKNLDLTYRIGVVDSFSGSTLEMPAVALKDNTNCYFIIVPNGENAGAYSYANSKDRNFHYFLPVSLDFTPKYASYTYDFTTNVLDSSTVATKNALAQSYTTANGTTKLNYDLTYDGLAPLSNAEGTESWSLAHTRFMLNTTLSGLTYSEVNSDGLRLLLYMSRYFDETLGSSNNYIGDASNWTAGMCTHVALIINVPAAGKYNLEMFNNVAHKYGAHTEVRFVPTTYTTLDEGEVAELYSSSDAQVLGWHDSSAVHNGSSENPAESFVVTAAQAGSYALIFATPNGILEKNRNAIRANDAESSASLGYQTLNLTKITLSEVDSEYNADPGEEEVNVDPGNVEAESEKTTATAVVSASSVDTENNYIGATIEKTETSVTAPQFAGENNRYEFLYWTKGIGDSRKIVSKTTSHTFDATPGNNIFFAVYRDTTASAPAKATFYNANGDILGTSAVADGKTTTLSLDKVSLPGFGKADGWKLADDDTVYGASTEVTVSDDASFVAYYEEEENTAGISVEDDVIIEIEDGKTSASYGDTVTVTAPLRRNNTEIFNYWTKNGEIVSFDRKYSFCAWDDSCELKAVYTNYVPLADTVRKIILGTITKDNETTVVAEFIGFDNAVERGIAFGTTEATASVNSVNRVVMNRKDLNHIAAIDDIGKGYVGYAIMSDGTVYYSNTDSE